MDIDMETDNDIIAIEVENETPIENESENEIFIFVDEQPEFQGGGVDKFRTWVNANLIYPAEASVKGIGGKV